MFQRGAWRLAYNVRPFLGGQLRIDYRIIIGIVDELELDLHIRDLFLQIFQQSLYRILTVPVSHTDLCLAVVRRLRLCL